AELGETRAQLAMAVLQRSVQQVAHDISP
ncbi:MAG: hypothetical protein QOG95_5445, partial [Mycobacterium sp.]|nr:hypothetical protein [Mycobacterium sp.]MDT7765285.1 hypothetical protein [Mycobacterium sp.]